MATAGERHKAFVLWEQLVTEENIGCDLRAVKNAIDGEISYLVEVSENGVELETALNYAPPEDYRSVIGIHGIELHVIPEGEKVD